VYPLTERHHLLDEAGDFLGGQFLGMDDQVKFQVLTLQEGVRVAEIP